VLSPEHRDTLDSMDTYAVTVGRRGDSDKATARTAMSGGARADPWPRQSRHPVLAKQPGQHSRLRGQWPEAERLLSECFRAACQEIRHDKVETIACLNNLSHTLLLQGRPEDARSCCRKEFDVMLGSHGERHIRTVHLQHLRTRILLAENRFEEAEKLGQKVLALRRDLLPRR